MIELQNISKIYKIGGENFYALNGVNLRIGKGEFVSVCGASGSGKTTLLNIIGCLDSYDEGRYLLEGTDVTKLSDRKKATVRNSKIGFVLQDFALINGQTVLYNVMLPLLLGKAPYRSIKDRAMKALQRMGIADQANKKASQLSGGQRQRVAIARAIVNEPSVILADEPTGQLDSKPGQQIMSVLAELNQQGIGVIAVTHDANVAAMAARTITVSDGRIVSDTNS